MKTANTPLNRSRRQAALLALSRAASAARSGATRWSAFSDQMVEPLEKRCLLSASMESAADASAAADVAPITVTYNGRMTFSKFANAPRQPAKLVAVSVTPTSDGKLQGTIAGEGLDDISFTGQLEANKRYTLLFEGDTQGTVSGKLPKDGTRMNGVMMHITDGFKSKLKLRAVDDSARALGAISSASTTQSMQVLAANGAFASPPPQFLSSEGELRFRGSYTGTTTLRFTPEVKQHYGPVGQFSTPTSYNTTLTITAENDADQLSGTMVVEGLGTYNVQGVVKFDDMTLIVTPVTPNPSGATSGVGVAKLKISRDGLSYGGQFRQESNDTWGFGSMSLTRRSSDVQSGISPPVTPLPVAPPQTQPQVAPSQTGGFNPPPEFLSSQGELRFGGTYSGSTTLRFTPEVKQHYGPVGPWSAPTTYNVTLNITSESTSDLLQGTMNVSGLGTYTVLGAVKLNDMTLIVTPQTPPVSGTSAGTGAIKLTISRNGFNYNGEFRQEANGNWGFGTMNLFRQTADASIRTGIGGTGGVVSPPTVPPTIPPTVPPTSPPTVPPTSPPTVPPDDGATAVTQPPTEPLDPTQAPIGNTPGIDIADQPDTTGGAGAPGIDNTFPGAPLN